MDLSGIFDYYNADYIASFGVVIKIKGFNKIFYYYNLWRSDHPSVNRKLLKQGMSNNDPQFLHKTQRGTPNALRC